MKKIIVILSILIVAFASCRSTYNTANSSYTFPGINYAEFTRISTDTCLNNADKIYLFFENEPIDFNYKKIGIIEIKGSEYTSEESFMKQLQYTAWKNKANGIIAISSNYTPNQVEVKVDNSNQTSTHNFTNSKFVKGIAVQINQDSVFTKKYGAGIDTSFIPQKITAEETQNKKKSNGVFISFWSVIIGTLLIVIASGY